MINHFPSSRSIPLLCFFLPLLSVLIAQTGSAGIVVTNTNDSGTGSLRQAFIEAEGAPGFDTIDFDPSLNGQTITLLSQITIASDQVGADASALSRGIVVSGGGAVRIFQVNSSAALNLTRLHLTRGNAGANNGGAILTTGTMTVTNCTFTENNAARGGAVFAAGPGSLTLQRSTFSNNTASDSAALWVEGTHSVILSNSTITLNRSTAAGGTGAITVFGGALNVIHSTISANAGDTFGGGIFTQASLAVERSIVAANTATGGAAADIFKGAGGTVGAIGPSLIGSNQSVTMEFPAAPPLVGTAAAPIDPKLGPLGNTGGATRTLAPRYDSPALNAAKGSSVATDQRGFPRFVGLDSTLDSDLGSVERGPLVTVTNANDANAGSLRAAINAATAPDTRIQFAAPSLNGATITLTSDQLFVNGKNVEFDASTLPSGLTISGNNARRVLLVDSGTLSLNRITIVGGNDGFGGAGLGVQSGGSALAVDCTLKENVSSGLGGAIFASSAIVDLHRCTLSGNTAGSGGAIWQQGFSQLSLTNCTVAGNQSAGSNGTGGLRCTDGTLNLVHTTITGNTGSNFAGGLFLQSPAVARIERCVIAGNFDPFPEKDIYRLGATIIPVGNNLIGINDSVSAVFPTNSLHGTSSMPLDAKLAPLGFYGGRTRTIPLRPTSPARDQGTGSTTVVDQRSFHRPVGAAADLGAYEAGTFANFAAWSEETAGAALSVTGDNDFDSAKNLLEYALRRNALTPDVQLSPTLSPTFNGLADAHLFSFRYQSAARDLRYIIQRNPDLLSAWENVATIDLSAGTNTGDPGLVINPALEMISLMDPPPDTDPAPPPANFYRLLVELVP